MNYSSTKSSAPLTIPSIPLMPDTAGRQTLRELNRALARWGYTDQPRSFMAGFEADIRRAMQDGNAERLAWVYRTEEWVLQGDQILDDIQSFICTGSLSSLHPDVLSRLWEELFSVTFKVQYMMAGVEVRLDQSQSRL
ncbi:hypothetical protein FKP32DRAFT_1576317 [Trametes sanguinea]|nr:hypothetical protein FKP32DRAFT_1576317 [Trametes sanguinea]